MIFGTPVFDQKGYRKKPLARGKLQAQMREGFASAVRDGKRKSKQVTNLARMRFQVDMNSSMTSKMIPLCCFGRAACPMTIERKGSV